MNQADQLQLCTKQFALRIINLCRVLVRMPGEARTIRDQLVRCGTAVAANYRAVCRSRSMNEFASRMAVVVEETDETVFWLELLAEAGTVPRARLSSLIDEAHELLRIFAAARKTTLTKIKNQKSEIKT